MAKQNSKQFKLDAVKYYESHKDLGVRGYAQNLGIGYSTLTRWMKALRESGDIEAETTPAMNKRKLRASCGSFVTQRTP